MDLYAVQENIEQQANYEIIQRFNNYLSNKKQTGTESVLWLSSFNNPFGIKGNICKNPL